MFTPASWLTAVPSLLAGRVMEIQQVCWLRWIQASSFLVKSASTDPALPRGGNGKQLPGIHATHDPRWTHDRSFAVGKDDW